MTDYGKTIDIDAYMQRLAAKRAQFPDHIIFRNKNLAKDLCLEMARLDHTTPVVNEAESARSNKFETMSPFVPQKKRIPPPNIAKAQVSS
jgi:hypothetical protein